MKKWKKILIVVVALVLISSLAKCGGSGKEEPAPNTEADSTEMVSEDEALAEEPTEEQADSEAAEEADEGSALLSPEFKKTMDDYEAWFDHYCEVMEKYKDNPTDMELLSEMTDLLTEETAMLEQMENMDESEMNNAELAYYIEVTARIEKKLLEVGA